MHTLATTPVLVSETRWQRRGPIIALLLLAPVISELLYGAMRLSVIFILIPEILTWGCGALLIRECVRSWRKGWISMLLMGVALAVAEEWVIQQTSIAPFVAGHAYGRAYGVNWIYFLWALGYESVWVVVLPVQLTELLFRQRRNQPWLRTRGRIITGISFALGARMAWYGWTQRARVKIFHLPPYTLPASYLFIGIGAILLLCVMAYALPEGRENNRGPRSAPAAWVVGGVFFALGAPWAAFALLGWGGGIPGVPRFETVFAFGLAWAALTLFLVRRWTSAHNWNDQHRFAVVFGGVLACAVGGFVVFRVGGALRIDWIGKAVFDAAAIVWLFLEGRKLNRATASEGTVNSARFTQC